MNIGIVGGGINGLCCAWQLVGQGHQVHLYEKNKLMEATSRASSKLLHGGLRYLENGEFRLVRESLRERDAWIQRAPELAKPLRLVMPIYKGARRSRWLVQAGLFLYDHLAGKSTLPGAKWITSQEMINADPFLNQHGLTGGFEFSDGQMDDYRLGLWVAEQAKAQGLEVTEGAEVTCVDTEGRITTADGVTNAHDRIINIAGPWADRLLERSGVRSDYRLDLVRGSHLVLERATSTAYLLEVPGERRIFFVLPWIGKTLVGTTEVRQSLDDSIECSDSERDYLLSAHQHYWPDTQPVVSNVYAGVRPLLHSTDDPGKATREYAIQRTGRLITVLGGKWTTAMALATKVATTLH